MGSKEVLVTQTLCKQPAFVYDLQLKMRIMNKYKNSLLLTFFQHQQPYNSFSETRTSEENMFTK
jgi:hypothetical protein